MIILGLNAYHGDSSAAIVVDGKLMAAIEEERIVREKHWAGFPSNSIAWCLAFAGIGIDDVDYIAVSRNPLSRMHKKLLRLIFKKQKISFILDRVNNYRKIGDIKERICREDKFKGSNIRAKVIHVEHHRAHLGSSFFVSPFSDSAVISIDGFGDFVSTMSGIGHGNRLRILSTVEFPHSLGIFYTALTQFLGFWNYGDEYKVMGLSAFGKEGYLDRMRGLINLKSDGRFELNRSYFLHENDGVDMTWLRGTPSIGGRLFSDKLISLLGQPRKDVEELSQRFRDIASSLQAMYEEAFFHLLNHLYKKTHLENICLSGGCLQNSLANGKITKRTNFKNIYIPPAVHDAGGAVGAAFYLWNHVLGRPRTFVMDSPYWGPKFEMKAIRTELERRGLRCIELNDDELIKKTAGDIASGKIVGWFQGKTEWGPRALGNRSILADPRREDIKDILNSRIKKREDFRPFAPSILVEKTGEWFEENRPVPFMEKVYKMKESKRSIVPAVTNIDGTGRLQTVSRDSNKKYYDLIKKFEEVTGVPLILNTSFNDNEPIVNTPADALDCFTKTKIDCLVLENFYIVRA